MGIGPAPPKKLRELGSSARTRQETTLGVRFPAALLLALIPLAPALAQGTALRTTCNGELITKIEIHSYLAGSSFAADAWTAATGFAGMHSTATRPEVIRAYLRVAEGTPCTELNRTESERLLRAQRFISSAIIRPIADGPGSVRLVVETVDEIPFLVGGSFEGTKFESLLLGTENLGGRGITLELSEQQGAAAGLRRTRS